MNIIHNKYQVIRLFCLTLTLSLTALTISCLSQTPSPAPSVNILTSSPAKPSPSVEKFKCKTPVEIKQVSPMPERSGGELNRAVLQRNVALVKKLLKEKSDPDEKDSFGDTPLILAVKSLEINEPAGLGGSSEMRERRMRKEAQAQIEMVKDLLMSGADINLRGNLNETALIEASFWSYSFDSNVEIVTMLIEHKADLNLQDDTGDTALMSAARAGSVERVKVLLARGANSDLVGCDNKTALSIAQEKKNAEIVRLLQAVK